MRRSVSIGVFLRTSCCIGWLECCVGFLGIWLCSFCFGVADWLFGLIWESMPHFFFYSFVQFLLICRYDSFSWMVFVVFLWLSQKIGLCVWLLFCFSYSVTLFQYWVLLAGERILFQLCGMKKYIHPKKILTCACLLTCEKHILFNRIFSNSFDVNKKTYILHIFKKYMTILYTYTVFGEISSNPIERKPLPIS